MRNFTGAVLTLGFVIALVGCSPALSEEAACEEIDAYSSEAAELIGNATDNLADDTRRNRFAERLSALGSEVSNLSIADDKLSETTLAWATAMSDFGSSLTANSVDELISDANADRFYAASDEWVVQDSTIRRLCKI